MVSQSLRVKLSAIGRFRQRTIEVAGFTKIASLHRAQMCSANLGLLKDESFETLGQISACRANHECRRPIPKGTRQRASFLLSIDYE